MRVHPRVTAILITIGVMAGIAGQVYSREMRSPLSIALTLTGCALFITQSFRISREDGWGVFLRSPLTIVGIIACIAGALIP